MTNAGFVYRYWRNREVFLIVVSGSLATLSIISPVSDPLDLKRTGLRISDANLLRGRARVACEDEVGYIAFI